MDKSLHVVSILCFAAAAGAACAQAPEELRRLLDAGKAHEAYALGKRSPERLGQPEFDFAFGTAAIDAGRAAEGVLALERVVLAQPGNDAARVELARGYYVLGDDARAKEEFRAVLARRPPAALAAVVEEYLTAIRGREAKYRPTAMAYLELGGGYDTNPRAGVDNPLITLPTLGEVTVGDEGLRKGDRTWQYATGFRLTGPVTAGMQAFAGAQAEYLRYRELAAFDQDVYVGSAGLQGVRERLAWRAGASTGYQTLGRVPYRRTHGGFADATFRWNETNAAVLGVQRGRFVYEGGNAVRSASFDALSAGWRRLFVAAWRPEIDVSGNWGRELNVYDDRQDLSRDLRGARVAVAAQPLPGWSVGAGLTFLRSAYRAPDIVLETTREDRYAAIDASIAWSPLEALQLRAELSASRNDSNIALYEYERRAALLRVRYEFR